VIIHSLGTELLDVADTVTEKVLPISQLKQLLLVSITAKVRPVAVAESRGLGDQLTETFVKSPPSPEVMADFVNPIMQLILTGDTLKVGRVTAVFVPPAKKSEEPEAEVTNKIGMVGQVSPSIVKMKFTAA
jgi:hypothetical protein